MAARRPKEASSAFVRAAARARAAGRRIEEAGLLGEAACCLEEVGESDARFEALLARAEAMICNDLGDATLAAVHAAEDAARTDDQRLRALLRKADYLGNCSDSAAAVETGRAGIALANKAKRKELAVLFSVVVAGGLCELRRVDEALALLEPFRAWAGTKLEPRSSIEFFIQFGIALDLANRLTDALGAFESAREIAAANGYKDLLATSLSNLATTTSKRGELASAVEFGRQALQLWREAEILKGTPLQTQTMLAHRLRDIGHYGEAIAMLEEALAEFRRAGTLHWSFSAAHRLALAYAHVGQHARALKLLGDDPAGLATKAQAIWIAHRAEVARLAGGAPLKPVRAALALLGGDLDDGNNRLVSLIASAIVPPEEGESMATAVAAWAAARERFGMAIVAHVRAAGCALALGAVDRAEPQIEAALRLFADHEPDNFYRAELWWVATQVFRAANRGARADRMLADGRDWITRIASEHVGAQYRDSFLNRNPVNRALLAAASRLS
jgi:tetratricopeptide (TPR) repeat protein